MNDLKQDWKLMQELKVTGVRLNEKKYCFLFAKESQTVSNIVIADMKITIKINKISCTQKLVFRIQFNFKSVLNELNI